MKPSLAEAADKCLARPTVARGNSALEAPITDGRERGAGCAPTHRAITWKPSGRLRLSELIGKQLGMFSDDRADGEASSAETVLQAQRLRVREAREALQRTAVLRSSGVTTGTHGDRIVKRLLRADTV